MLTLGQISSYLDCDLHSGEIRWKVTRGKANKGTLAGNVDLQTGYLRIGIEGTLYYAHRLVWLFAHGRWPKEEIDHINRQRVDNRLVNLREATRGENQRNMGLIKSNRSGYRGVYWAAKSGKWGATIKIKRRSMHLGLFDLKEDAYAARLTKEAEIFGQFANPEALRI